VSKPGEDREREREGADYDEEAGVNAFNWLPKANANKPGQQQSCVAAAANICLSTVTLSS